MEIVNAYLTKNPCYQAGRTIAVKGLMLHSVGCPQPDATVFVRNWNRPDYSDACVHGFISAIDGKTYQTLPWNFRGWHAGGSANNTHIGVEMCEPDCIRYVSGATFRCSDIERARSMADRAYKSAVELFAYLCKQYKLNPLEDGVIISHREGALRGVASNHGDPDHLWKQLGMNYTMDTFRKAVNDALGNVQTNTQPAQQTAVKPTTEAKTDTFTVRVLIDDLNIRKTPNGQIVGQTGKGVFTIVAVDGDWGKLKSGAGWIYLAEPTYTQRTDIKTGNTSNTGNAGNTAKKTNEEIAREVIKGLWGNGSERKRKLTQAGYDYGAVQDIVNTLMSK